MALGFYFPPPTPPLARSLGISLPPHSLASLPTLRRSYADSLTGRGVVTALGRLRDRLTDIKCLGMRSHPPAIPFVPEKGLMQRTNLELNYVKKHSR